MRRLQGPNPRLEVDESLERSGVVPLLLYFNSGRTYDLRWPREKAVCDLNLERWRQLVMQYGIEGEAKEVLNGCLEGFHQGIPNHRLGNRRWYTPKNYESAIQAAEKITNTIAKERRAN